jgi:lipopolysaccharide/colanic/teichoic acid biosynthesis glycosyltransferase
VIVRAVPLDDTAILARAARVAGSPVKRALDVAFALAGLAISAPVWPILALAIRLEDAGPVFFRQARAGLGGRTFQALKFRSMRTHAARVDARQAVAGDPRVTRVGRFMRATALDELPQLVNILRDDMSVVGPRALWPGEIEVRGPGVSERIEDVAGFAVRSAVRPGLTGVAQIYAARDRLYIRRQSLALDVRLIMLSFWISVRGTWEQRGAPKGQMRPSR